MGIRMSRTALVGLVVAALMLLAVSPAVGASEKTRTTRSISSADNSLTIALESAGDAGRLHGNGNYATSPVDASGEFYWFNKPVRVTDFAFANRGHEDPVFTSATFGLNTGSGYAAPSNLSDPFIVSFDGVYRITARGADAGGAVHTTIEPAFGVDTTTPRVSARRGQSASAVPIVTITATDTMSGVQNAFVSVDSASYDSWEPDPAEPSSFSVALPLGGGVHTLSWIVFDNAGNAAEGAAAFSADRFTIAPSKSNSHGSITPSGRQTVSYGDSKTFVMRPFSGYKISKVVVDGKSVGAKTSYTFRNVKANHTIKVYFVRK